MKLGLVFAANGRTNIERAMRLQLAERMTTEAQFALVAATGGDLMSAPLVKVARVAAAFGEGAV